MKNIWSMKWKKVLIWFSGYISFLAFALVGGYTLVKSEDEELKKTAKQTFIVVLIFAAISALLSLFHNVCGLSDKYYSSAEYGAYSILSKLVAIAQVIVYAVFVVTTLVKTENE